MFIHPIAILRLACLASCCLWFVGCARTSDHKPDLARLYQSVSKDPNQPPVILIHGLMGSTLVDAQTGKQFWPGSLGTMAFSNYRDLARMDPADREGEGLVPGGLFYGIASVDYYSELIRSLEQAGRFKRGQPGVAVGQDRRRYYVLVYDWRRDNVEAARKLHALIDQIRIDYQDQKLRVDIIAHSNGGLIANYYLRYGAIDVLDESEFYPWDDGVKRIRRIAFLGTPNLGAVTSLERLFRGFRIALRTVPVEVMATFATPFEALPHPLVKPIVDIAGNSVDIDLYDPNTWRTRHWSVFSPEVETRVRASANSPEAGERALTELQATFVRHLQRALRFQWSLTAPFHNADVEAAVFGGDCKLTLGHAVLIDESNGSRLAFRPGEIPWLTGEKKLRHHNVDYEQLLFEPGDGLVTRSSQVSRETTDPDQPSHDYNFLPITQTVFLCERHGRLTSNTYFQNNLLYFLLAR